MSKEAKKYYFKYYFKVNDYGTCSEQCLIKPQKIGSVACKLCEHCLGHNDKEGDPGTWIKCSKQEDAIEKLKQIDHE